MGRPSKPYFHKGKQRWLATINGRKITLGAEKVQALLRFHELTNSAARNPEAPSQNPAVPGALTVQQLFHLYSEFLRQNRSEKTLASFNWFVDQFLDQMGCQAFNASDLRAFHLQQWLDMNQQRWNSTTRSDAAQKVLTMLKWAVEQQYLDKHPIPAFRKPRRQVREVFYTEEQWALVKSHIPDQAMLDLLEFLWTTGARPQEARKLTAEYVMLEKAMCVLPRRESKGGMGRVIYMPISTTQLVSARAKKYPQGPIFRNTRGNPWTKDAVVCRLRRLSKKVGFRVIAYGTRHSFCSRALVSGSDTTVVAELMGHTSKDMVAKVYAKLSQNHEFLAAEAAKINCSGNNDEHSRPELRPQDLKRDCFEGCCPCDQRPTSCLKADDQEMPWQQVDALQTF